MNSNHHFTGIDIGSTTAKLIVLEPGGERVLSYYRRHYSEILVTLQNLLDEAQSQLGDIQFKLQITGSAGMGLCEKFELPFIQEVIASAEVVRHRYPHVKVLMDIGGEDAKLIFFDENGNPDIRMNGSCAGGTGAFIDQMATLLNVPVDELDTLARNHSTIHPIASRCGVFAKTDVQNLLSRDATREDIAASIFHAVVWQTLATLARGHPIQPVVLFAGGPLTFLPQLRQAYIEALELLQGDWLEIEGGELFTATGAALAADRVESEFSFNQLRARLLGPNSGLRIERRLEPLFFNRHDFQKWEASRNEHRVKRANPEEAQGHVCFLGIDSGSTTTKLALIDESGRLIFDDYRPNHGNPIQAARQGLERLREAFQGLSDPPLIVRSAVTGYGEDLIRAAFGCDDGIVETLAHYMAAKAFDPQVSFILDIGGQDMKAIFVNNGHIQRIEINEACSSGCGTFVETFANSLGQTASEFAQAACKVHAPCDLGTRCTVFMNSRVKQAQREGAEVGEISAGLAYSVIKNALYKVLKITDPSILGEHIVVQGGSFRNQAIHKAMERELGRPVICPDKAELMGALGAALAARDQYLELQGDEIDIKNSTPMCLENLEAVGDYEKRLINCRGCENKCTITRLTFPNQNKFFTGNRCEQKFSNQGQRIKQGTNLLAKKLDLLFKRPMEPQISPRMTIGIPRALNTFENFPFWCTLFVESGIKVQLSDDSNMKLFESGAQTVMSENICFPAKLLHGHIYNLAEAGVERIFYPMVFYEKQEFEDTINCYNCPVVSGYPDVVRSAINPQKTFNIPFDQLPITFQDPELLKQTCEIYLKGLGVPQKEFERAFDLALAAQDKYKVNVQKLGSEIIASAKQEGRLVVVLAGHPYHIDPLINHKIPDALADMGVEVISEDAVPISDGQTLESALVLTQWEYLNRYFHAAHWVGMNDDTELMQLNSFGCGPDAFAMDEVRDILTSYRKNHTILRIDEIDSLGSARLRMRSMIETLAQQKREENIARRKERETTRLYHKRDRQKTILVPEFSDFCTWPIVRPAMDMGYNIQVLPPSDRESVEVGLKYTNNEICYPGIIVIGDVIKALQSGAADPEEVIAGSWETGGQCRASNISCLLKKALVATGYKDVPVITLSTRLKSFNPQPDFEFNLVEYLYKAMLGMAYSDGISAMHHATLVREIHPGDTQELTRRWMGPFEDGSMQLTKRTVLDNLQKAVDEYNSIPTHTERLPKVGIVGEIYVKYNTFVNSDIVRWLMERKIEVILPPLLTFFLGSFVGFKAGVHARIKRRDFLWYLTGLGKNLVESFLDKTEGILHGFRNYHPHRKITEVGQTASEIVALTHQYGEGWLLSGEIGEFVKSGVNNVICLQPFGCIANHVIAKGVARRLKETYAGLNLLFLDLDAGSSEVNLFNRAHFFVERALTGMETVFD